MKSKGDVTCHHGVKRYKQRQTVVNVLVKKADRNGMLAFYCFFARATFLTMAAQKPNKNKAKNNHNEVEQTGENKTSAPIILKKKIPRCQKQFLLLVWPVISLLACTMHQFPFPCYLRKEAIRFVWFYGRRRRSLYGLLNSALCPDHLH